MYLTVHAAAGALIGNQINNALLAFILGFLSHFILDRIPHKDPASPEDFLESTLKLSKKMKQFIAIVIIDIALLSFLTLLFFKRDIFIYASPVAFGIFGAILPDILAGFYILTGNKYLKKFQKIHNAIHFDHKKINVSIGGGMATQVIMLAIIIRLILKNFLNS